MEQRKILFKAKCIADGEWAKGYYYKKPLYKKILNGDIVEDGEVYCIYGMTKDDVHLYWYEVDPSTVCQFTGLKDSKGQDVYENDILEHINNTDIKVCIEWREHRYVLKEVGKEILHLALQRTLDDLVVIGNKFDRKEEK